MAVTQEDVISALKQCYDPEIPVNIVDLGLIYESDVSNRLPEDKQDVTVDMTLTAQGCPSHVEISAQVKSRLESAAGSTQRERQHRVDAGVDAGASERGCAQAVGD